MTKPPLTLHDFLQQIGARPLFFDLGRRISEIPAERLRAFEEAREPWPSPFQQAAWLGILFHASDGEPHLWFLRFPLDERGLLVQAARDEFLRGLLATAAQGGETAGPQDNPFGFKPNETQMAVLHAQIARRLAQPASPHYAHALAYFRGEQGFDQWQFVGLQGIADLAMRQHEHTALLAAAIPQLPAEPFNVLCSALESEAIEAPLFDAIATRLRTMLTDGADAVHLAAGLRGVAGTADRQRLIGLLGEVLATPQGAHPEILAAIAGRAWEALYDDALRGRFLQRLADSGQRAFDSILADLLFLPVLRTLLLADIRSADQPPAVRQAVTAFVQRFGQTNAREGEPS